MKQPQIFLAHASEDKPEVEKIYKRLENKGYKPWMDKKDLLPGQNWRVEIPNAIKQSQIFIACFSQISVTKVGYVQQEFKLAFDQAGMLPPGRIFFIPLRLDDCEVPPLELPRQGMSLRDLHRLDYWESDAFEKLVKSIDNVIPPAEPKALNSPHRIWTRPKRVTNSPPVTRPFGGNSPTNTPSNSASVTSQVNNKWLASIGASIGVVILLVGVSTGISVLNQDPPREDTSTSPIETAIPTPEQPTPKTKTSPTPTPEPTPTETPPDPPNTARTNQEECEARGGTWVVQFGECAAVLMDSLTSGRRWER